MNAVPLVGLIAISGSVLAWLIHPMMFLGWSLGLMFTSAMAMWLHRRELRRIQKEGPEYLDWLLGDD